MNPTFMVSTAVTAGMVTGAAVTVLVMWETLDWLTRRSRYSSHALGHLWSRTGQM